MGLMSTMAFAADDPVITNLTATRDSETTATITFDSTQNGSVAICFKNSDGTFELYIGDKDGVTVGTNVITYEYLTGSDAREIAVYFGTDESDFDALYSSENPLDMPGAVKGTVSAVHTCVGQGDWQYDPDNHWKLCGICGNKVDEAAHSGGTATCASGAICEDCGNVYGAVNPANHTNLVKTEAVAATHMKEGNIEYWHCDGCDKYFEDAAGTVETTVDKIVIPKLTEHTAGTEWKYDETNHWNVCECGEIMNETAHDYEWVTDKEATATEAGSKHEECTVCGYKKAAVEIPATGDSEEPDTDDTTTDPDDTTTPEESDEPKTGDDASAVLWIVLLGVSVIGACVTAVHMGKEKSTR